MSKLRSTLALAIVGLLTGGILAAIVGPPDGGDDISLIAHSAEAVTDAGSFRASFTMGMTVPPTPGLAGESFTAEGEGEFDDAGPAARVTMHMGMAGETIDIEMVVLGTIAYLKMSGFPGDPLPTPWVSFDFAETPGMAEVLGSGFGSNDPSQFVDFLHGAGDAEHLGREDVRGVSTTHYRGTVDMEEALDALPEEERDALEESMNALGENVSLDIDFPVEVWIDDEGLPRRMSMAMDMSGLGDEVPAGTTMDFTMEMYDFGAVLDIQPPLDDQVTDLTEVIGSDLS